MRDVEAADAEIEALRICYRELRIFDAATQKRMFAWLSQRLADEREISATKEGA